MKEVVKIYKLKKKDKDFIVVSGIFIESLSHSIKDKAQKYINIILDGYKYNKARTIAHIPYLIKN